MAASPRVHLGRRQRSVRRSRRRRAASTPPCRRGHTPNGAVRGAAAAGVAGGANDQRNSRRPLSGVSRSWTGRVHAVQQVDGHEPRIRPPSSSPTTIRSTAPGLVDAIAERPDLELLAECAGGREAVEQILERRPKVALLDMRMRDLDGMAVLEELTARRVAHPRRVPVGLRGGRGRARRPERRRGRLPLQGDRPHRDLRRGRRRGGRRASSCRRACPACSSSTCTGAQRHLQAAPRRARARGHAAHRRGPERARDRRDARHRRDDRQDPPAARLPQARRDATAPRWSPRRCASGCCSDPACGASTTATPRRGSARSRGSRCRRSRCCSRRSRRPHAATGPVVRRAAARRADRLRDRLCGLRLHHVARRAARAVRGRRHAAAVAARRRRGRRGHRPALHAVRARSSSRS